MGKLMFNVTVNILLFEDGKFFMRGLGTILFLIFDLFADCANKYTEQQDAELDI